MFKTFVYTSVQNRTQKGIRIFWYVILNNSYSKCIMKKDISIFEIIMLPIYR